MRCARHRNGRPSRAPSHRCPQAVHGVAEAAAAERLLDTYQAERRPLATTVLRGSTAATKVNIAGSPLGRLLRDQVLVRLFNQAWIQRWTTYTTSQLWVSYRRGPLGGRGRKPRPGDRIGDPACQHPDGSRTRLHAELRGRWAVLGDGTDLDAAFEAARQRLGDRVARLHTDGPTDGTAAGPALLVRPDAHLACKGGRADIARWLDGALA